MDMITSIYKVWLIYKTHLRSIKPAFRNIVREFIKVNISGLELDITYPTKKYWCSRDFRAITGDLQTQVVKFLGYADNTALKIRVNAGKRQLSNFGYKTLSNFDFIFYP